MSLALPVTASPLANMFFSNLNIKSIQEQLRYQVWLKSDKKYVIGYQDQHQLLIVMRSIYLQYSKITRFSDRHCDVNRRTYLSNRARVWRMEYY